MVSANGQPFVAPSADAGADGFLHKPVSVMQLIEVLGPLMAAAAEQLAERYAWISQSAAIARPEVSVAQVEPVQEGPQPGPRRAPPAR